MNPQDPCMINELRSVAFSKVHSEEEKKKKKRGWLTRSYCNFILRIFLQNNNKYSFFVLQNLAMNSHIRKNNMPHNSFLAIHNSFSQDALYADQLFSKPSFLWSCSSTHIYPCPTKNFYLIFKDINMLKKKISLLPAFHTIF